MTTELAQTKELAFLMSERFTMNPISCKHLNEAWREAFPDEVAVAKRMLALVEALEASKQDVAKWFKAFEKAVSVGARYEEQIAELRVSNRILCSDAIAKQDRIAELEEAQSLHDEGVHMLCGQFDELAAAMGWTSELAEKQGVSQLEYARWLNVRIAELEARKVKLPKPISVLHRRDFNDAHRAIYAYPEAEVNAALAAAGVAVEGE